MTRTLAGAAFVAALLGSTAAFAAATTTSAATSTTAAAATTTAAPAKVDYGARCTSLADQWKTAEAANASNASLGKAKADAAKGEKLCKSKKSSDKKKGSGDYEAALKLLGVTPS